jgi:DNA-binding transcriptional ArsR family regulator
MYVIKKNRQGLSSLPAIEITPQNIKSVGSPLAQKILSELGKKEMYAMELAKKLKVHEQKIYYHLRCLEKARIISETRSAIVEGATARYYALRQPAFVVRFKEFQTTQKLKELEIQPKSFLEPFIEDGQLNATIIVGSPDPHGPEKARSRDGYYGIDLALFFGTFLNTISDLHVKLDTETRSEDLQNNLIIMGGPVVNTITEKINNKLTIHFDRENNWNVISTISNKKYHTDETGIIVKQKNPFNPKKQILVIAGKRYAGTKAVVITFLKYFNDILKGNKYDQKIIAKVVEGVDLDSDGIVDDVEILE